MAELVFLAGAAVTTYLAISDTVSAAVIAAAASLGNTALLLWNRRQGRQEREDLGRRLGDPEEHGGNSALHELRAVHRDVADARDQLRALVRVAQRQTGSHGR